MVGLCGWYEQAMLSLRNMCDWLAAATQEMPSMSESLCHES